MCSGDRHEEDLCSSGVIILNQDFTSALETLQDAQSKAIGAPKVTSHSYEQINCMNTVERRAAVNTADIKWMRDVSDKLLATWG